MKYSLFSTLCAAAIFVTQSVSATPLEDGKAAFATGDYGVAMQAFGEGFRGGDAASGYYLARMFELGLGVEQDVPASVRLYRAAAEGGNVEALNRVALMHYRGEQGAVQDHAEAARLFGLAAGQGDRNAQFNLGKMYFEGEGVEQDAAQAIAHYRQAADQDHILALNTLGFLHRAGAVGEADLELAAGYFARSAAYGNAVGLFETARVTIESGTEAEQLITAHMYLNLAAARSHPNAPDALQELTGLMRSEDVQTAQSNARDFVALTDETVE